MKKILTAKQMKECDLNTIAMGTPSSRLMERAGRAVFDTLVELYDTSKTLVICGSGNNGGDGLIVALYLDSEGYDCDVWYVGEGHTMTEETKKRYNEAWNKGVSFVDTPDLSDYSVIVDAVLGTGLSFEPTGLARDSIYAMNDCDTPVVSIDMPSGISADTGKALGEAVLADTTVTMQAYKMGHILSDGIDASGNILCAELGIDTSSAAEDDAVVPLALEEKDLSLIPRRKRDSHKGDFGRVLVMGGSVGMCGASYLSALAAYKCGAGIVEIFAPFENREILQTLLPEAIVTSYIKDSFETKDLLNSIDRASVIVIGPGLGVSDNTLRMVKEVFKNSNAPLIVDADALNVIARENMEYPTDVPIIVTPHQGELARLTGKNIKSLLRDPIGATMEYAREKDVICVSKNARTVITDGVNVFVNMTGGPSIAKGGSGDVLCGVIAGMLTAGLSPIGAASIGAYVHGRAGDTAGESLGGFSVLARDIIDAIPGVLRNVKGKM